MGKNIDSLKPKRKNYLNSLNLDSNTMEQIEKKLSDKFSRVHIEGDIDFAMIMEISKEEFLEKLTKSGILTNQNLSSKVSSSEKSKGMKSSKKTDSFTFSENEDDYEDFIKKAQDFAKKSELKGNKLKNRYDTKNIALNSMEEGLSQIEGLKKDASKLKKQVVKFTK